MSKAIQDLYPDDVAHCYGCGKNNLAGLHLKTYLTGDETISYFTPDSQYTAIPGAVYGGLIASLLDCHGTGSAAAFICKKENIPLEAPLQVRCMTASLKIDFRQMTPLGVELNIRGRLKSISGRKVVVEMTLSANEQICVTAEILAIRMKK